MIRFSGVSTSIRDDIDQDALSQTLNQKQKSEAQSNSATGKNLFSDKLAEQQPKESEMANNYSQWAGSFPGLSFIRNSVIKPLLFATETLVEQYMPVASAQVTLQGGNQ